MPIMNFVDSPKSEDYKKRFKEHFITERGGGIIMCRVHYKAGGAVMREPVMHRAVPHGPSRRLAQVRKTR